MIDGQLTPLLLRIDKFITSTTKADREATPVSRRIADLRTAWRTAVALADADKRADAEASLQSSHAKAVDG